ncbi:MAG: alpha/beta fold hydrolase [Cyclobacteriaceae bacterium]
MDSYTAPNFYISPHLETIIPALFRRVANVHYERERISTPDGDFLDLDWLTAAGNSTHLVIISHGLEGDSRRPYVKGMARAFSKAGFDVLAWNFRGCSGEMNLKPRFYHSGATDDLHTVISHARNEHDYRNITLIGFSLGGNLTLKYLGERKLFPEITSSVVFSVPLQLHSSCLKISRPENFIYARRFINSLKAKIRMKERSIPGSMDLEPLDSIRTLIQFDDTYTAPLHGFRDAVDYYTRCSSLFYLDDIEIPTLIVNARNDPFLSDECFPVNQLSGHSSITFKTPRQGGHVGFTSFNSSGLFWSEQQALHFVQNQTAARI